MLLHSSVRAGTFLLPRIQDLDHMTSGLEALRCSVQPQVSLEKKVP